MATTTNKAPTNKNVMTYRKAFGDEPIKIDSISDLARAYYWYGYMYDSDQSRQWLLEYTKYNHPDKVKAVSEIDIVMNGLTDGWTARMLLNGLSLPPSSTKRLEKLIVNSRSYEATKTEIKDRNDKIDQYLPDFEDAVDNASPFSAYEYLTRNSVPQSYAKRIGDYYTPWLEELRESLSTKDDQLKEGYRYLNASKKKERIAFLSSIVEDCNRFIDNKNKTRKPRKKKPQSVANKLKFFKYMASFDKLKITSVDPLRIVGAKQLFTFNTKNNVMTIYNAKDGNGLDVHRTSITNFDEKTTKAKRVGRKQKEVIETVLNGTKPSRDKVLETLNVSYIAVPERINTDVVLLRVVK